MNISNALENLDRHWAVKVVTPEDRSAAIQYGMGVLTRLGNGDAGPATGVVNGSSSGSARSRGHAIDGVPDFVVPLAGAYVIAASEWLDFEGAASPATLLSPEQEAQRAA